MIGTTAITSALGFIYWWLAARCFLPEEVGFASAAISTMMLLGNLGVLGFGTLLIGELPSQHGREKSLISTALITAGFTGGVLGIFFALLAPWVSIDLHPLSESIINIATFSLGVCLTAIVLVLDQALVGLLRGWLQFWRNIVMAVVKLGALLVVSLCISNRSGLSIYIVWTFGNMISLVVIAGLAFSESWDLCDFKPQWGLLRKLGRTALGHHALNLSLQITGLVLPIMVTSLLSVRMNAYFYTAWMIASLAFVGPVALTTVLYAVVTSDRGSLVRMTHLTLKLSLLVGLVVSVVLMAASDLILRFFGASYAQEAVWSLKLLSLGVYPMIIRTHYVAIHRIFGQVVKAAKIMFICVVFELVLSAVGSKLGGLSGLSLGWLVANCIEAALMARIVYRAATSGELSSTHLANQNNAIVGERISSIHS